MANGTPDDGEAPVIVSITDAAMHMYAVAIDELPDPDDSEFAKRAGVVLTGLRKLEGGLSEAAGRSRVTPSVIVALSKVRASYGALMEDAANGPGSTLGQRLYVARQRAKLTPEEAANGAGMSLNSLRAIEAEQSASEEDSSKVKELITALGE